MSSGHTRTEIRRESDLSEPVSRWLAGRGFRVYAEVSCQDSVVDLVAVDRELIVMVELKLSLSTAVFQQAMLNQVRSNLSYVAVATNPRRAGIERCGHHGIGVIRVNRRRVQEILAPRPAAFTPNYIYLARLREYLSTVKPGGTGGVATKRIRERVT